MKSVIDRYTAATFTINRRMNALFREAMPEELTVDQYSTVQYIRQRGACTSSELADIFCVGKSTITAIITRLADKRLLSRVPDEKDRRVTYLRLTEEGERLCDQAEETIQQLLEQLIEHFDEEEAELFLTMYEKLARILVQTYEKEEGGEGA